MQKMAFQTCYCHYKFVVIPFELTNAPAASMHLINLVCMPMLNWSMIVFIDDILVYNKTQEQHDEHLREILETLRKERVYEKFSKCELWSREASFLGHIVNQNGIVVDPTKIEAVMR